MNIKVSVYARILREERLPTRMRFYPFDLEDDEDEVGFFVYQMQRFRFLIGVSDHIVQVRLNMTNFVWKESDNTCHGSNGYPTSETEIQVTIHLKTNQGWETLFKAERLENQVSSCICHRLGCEDCQGFTVRGMGDGALSFQDVVLNIELVVLAMEMCVFHLEAHHDGPSVSYMMALLRRILDAAFFWDGEVDDRIVTIEWTYKPAMSVEEWHENLCDEYDNTETREFDLDELPWYRDTYDQERRLMARWLQSRDPTSPNTNSTSILLLDE
jgi:hypothetical protein